MVWLPTRPSPTAAPIAPPPRARPPPTIAPASWIACCVLSAIFPVLLFFLPLDGASGAHGLPWVDHGCVLAMVLARGERRGRAVVVIGPVLVGHRKVEI